MEFCDYVCSKYRKVVIMKLIYPACFYPCEAKKGYTVVVPDLPGCVSEGNSLSEAIMMGTDAAYGWIIDEMQEGNPLPKATDIDLNKTEDDSIIILLVLDMDTYAEKDVKKLLGDTHTSSH